MMEAKDRCQKQGCTASWVFNGITRTGEVKMRCDNGHVFVRFDNKWVEVQE